MVTNNVPVSTAELWGWSATRLRSSIASGEISAREAVQSCLDRIDSANPSVNALVEVSHAEALAEADRADQLQADGAELGLLHGVPIAIKIDSAQKGHATTLGVAAFADAIAESDSPHVANLRRAGAIIVGRSNAPAFSFRWFTDNDLHGKTLNPWDSSRTPGGSSGGAAAAVSAGMVPIGQAGDIGGSIRYPAYACGAVGLRPTVGRVAGLYGQPDEQLLFSVQCMAVQGAITRTVEDARLALRALEGTDPRDPIRIPGTPRADPPPYPVRVGLLRTVGDTPPTPVVDEALQRSAQWLSDAGYMVEPVELPMLDEAYRLWHLLCLEDFRLLMPIVEQVCDEKMQQATANFFAVAKDWWGPRPDLTAYMNGYARRGTLIRQLSEVMRQYPFILLPVSAEQAFEQDADIVGIESMRRCVAAQASMVGIPVLGLPAASIPTGIVNGLPTGVQILGRRFDEDRILDIAAILESRAGTFTPVEPV